MRRRFDRPATVIPHPRVDFDERAVLRALPPLAPMFAESCASGKPNELTAHNGNVAVAVVYAALKSIDRKGQAVRVADVIEETHAKIGTGARAA